MTKTFSVELSMPEPPEEAQARAATALKNPAQAVGLGLTRFESPAMPGERLKTPREVPRNLPAPQPQRPSDAGTPPASRRAAALSSGSVTGMRKRPPTKEVGGL